MKKILFPIFFLILLSSFVSATYSTDRTKYYWDDIYYIAEHIGNSLTLNGSSAVIGSSPAKDAWTLIGGSPTYEAKNISGVDDNVSILIDDTGEGVSYTILNETFTGNVGFTINVTSILGAYSSRISVFNGSEAECAVFIDTSATYGSGAVWYHEGCGSTYSTCDNSIGHNRGKKTTIMFNFSSGTDIAVYINDTLCYTFVTKGISKIRITEAGRGSDLDWWTNDIWVSNGDRPLATVLGSLPTPTIQPPSPADNTKTNVNVTLNVSHPSLNKVRFYLYFGTSLTLKETDLYVNNATRTGANSTHDYKNFTTNVSDGTYYWKWRVQNITDGRFSLNTTVRTLTIDTTIPTLTLGKTNSFNSSNVSLTNQYLDYIYFNISMTDETDLFGFMINITRGSTSIFNFTNVSLSGNTIYTYSDNISTAHWPSGVYDIEVAASDSSTVNAIFDYDISQFLSKITFDTDEGNEISISGSGAYSTNYLKSKDRYEFGFDYLLKNTERKFTIKAKNKIYYLPNSKYDGHFVILNNFGGNWVEFEGIGKDYTVKKISDYEYDITFVNLPLDNKIITKSIGGINKVTKYYKWYKGNYTTISPDSTTYGSPELFVLNISRNSSYVTPTAVFFYNGTSYSSTTSSGTDYIAFSRTLTIPQPIATYENVSFYWNVTVTQQDDSIYSFSISDSVNVSDVLVDNCSVGLYPILNITGKDEETDIDVNLSLNIYISSSSSESRLINSSFELKDKVTHTLCVRENNTQYTIDSIMEYGDGVTYTDRKYYLNDFIINTSIVPEVYLYHLNDTKASEIIFTVFDTTTGDKVPGAYIKILRYYPGENVFRVVEISKTDEVGQTLGKMVLADVFYKFIIESPAGTVKLSTDVLRILSLTRSFGISFVEDYLDTWHRVYSVVADVSCTKGTQTCRVTWSDSSNVVQDVTLEVWRINGLSDQLLFSQTTAAAAGTISYTVIEDVTGNRYVAKGFLESNTGTSTYPISWDEFFFSDNPFFTDETHRLASLFPLFMLAIVLLCVFLDFGVIGVTISSLLILAVGVITKILPMNPFYFMSMISIGILLIYRLSK